MSKYLRDYRETFTVPPQPQGEALFGFELEVEFCAKGALMGDYIEAVRMNRAAKRLSKYDNIMCKGDGSLVCGFEIISRPGTVEYYLGAFDWTWLKHLRRAGAFCSQFIGEKGLHIHVSRTAFIDDAHIDRFERLILTDAIARQLVRLAVMDNVYAERTPQYCYVDNYRHRYCVVSRHERTVEVRNFMPTLYPIEIIGYMEYMQYAINDTREDS